MAHIVVSVNILLLTNTINILHPDLYIYLYVKPPSFVLNNQMMKLKTIALDFKQTELIGSVIPGLV